MSTPNTKIWDELRRVPPEHLKPFSRAGGFKGTAIKPMWSFHRMTEMFGAAGQGWGVNEPSFQIVPAGDEILVFCTVSVWYEDRKNVIFGVGGDKVRVVQANGPRNDDEAFKKAYTDATTNALKLLGVAADIHMGLWDGNKYTDDKTHENVEKEAPSKNAETAAPAHFPAQSSVFTELRDQLGKIESHTALEAWVEMVKNAITANTISMSERATLQNQLQARRAFVAQAPGKAA